MAAEQQRPLDISCIDLDQLRAQALGLGFVVLTNSRPLTAARHAILESISPGGLIRLQTPGPESALEIPSVKDPFHQQLIRETREEALLSECWWRQVGCAVGNPETEEVIVRTHNTLPERGNFCRGLETSAREVIKLLGPGERLEFCPARHAENVMVPLIQRMKLPIESMDIGLNVDPCDHCGYLLADIEPKGVYIDFNPNNKYYNPLGIRILQLADIPVYFVRMPGE